MKRVKRLLALVLVLAMAMSLMPGALAAGSPYTDVPAGHWAEDYIAHVTEQGLMDGVGDGRFSPSGAMDRAMFVVVLARMAGAETDNTAATGFSDVAENQYYTGAVAWASGLGGVCPAPGRDRAPSMLKIAYRLFISNPPVKRGGSCYPRSRRASSCGVTPFMYSPTWRPVRASARCSSRGRPSRARSSSPRSLLPKKSP